ncbi:MAG TPA: ATP-binding protein [Acidimicrobiales bacterium]|nr:ATP-binding protein [Acidimicrobiales bacterium]
MNVRDNVPLAAAVALGAGGTLFVTVLPFASFAYENPALHLALETAEGLIALLLAYLAAERYRATRRLQHVALAWVFSVLAFGNLVMSAGPLVAGGARPGGWLTWATLGLRLAGAGALFAAAWVGLRPSPPGRVVVRALAGGTVVAAALVGLGALAAGAGLGEPVGPGVAARSGTRPHIEGHPVVLAIQLVSIALYAGAAARFSRQAGDQGDELLRWVGAGAALAAFARLNYFLFPSLYSDFVYTGDLLRLASYLFFLVGAGREIHAYWRDQARLAAVEERRRVARDLHDGLTQELAFIRSQAASLAAGVSVPGMAAHLAAAADRALAESRRAVEVLSGGDHAEPLAQALARAAEEVAGRAGAAVTVEAEGSHRTSRAAHEALTRVVREATTNAVRHGGARSVCLRLEPAAGPDADGALRLVVRDDGLGFDPAAVTRGYGLRSMRERVEGLDGELAVRSAPGQGTVIEIRLPASPGSAG